MATMTSSNADPVDALICSRKGCSADAVYGMLWNNPKLHTPERRKVWLACAEHEEVLREHLAVRAFPVATCAVDEIPDDAG